MKTSSEILDIYYDKKELDAAIELACVMSVRDLHQVMMNIPTKVEKGDEYDTLENTDLAMSAIIELYKEKLSEKIEKNIEKSRKELQQLVQERDGV